MPPTVVGYPSTAWSTLLFLGIFFLAFFPNIFITIIESPIHLASHALQSRHSAHTYPDPPPLATMSWFQKTINLPPKSRGSYLITDVITSSLPELRHYKIGILHLFIQHTSCALSMNENWDEDVRADMSDALDRLVPEDRAGKGVYRHDAEGPDDMPAHVKSALVGSSVSIPIRDGRLATGTWQGVWYLEFREARHSRKVVATINGEKM
jgi:secondary thiamine-phosphate synthase enzyme